MNGLNDEEFIYIFRQQRHDFLNHIQVILGYLQIGQKDMAIDYIHRIIDEANDERRIFQLNIQTVARLLKLKYELKKRGINLYIKIDDIVEGMDISEISIETAERYGPDVELHISKCDNGAKCILSKKEGD